LQAMKKKGKRARQNTVLPCGNERGKEGGLSPQLREPFQTAKKKKNSKKEGKKC